MEREILLLINISLMFYKFFLANFLLHFSITFNTRPTVSFFITANIIADVSGNDALCKMDERFCLWVLIG